MNRRTFLRRSIWAAALLGTAALIGPQIGRYPASPALLGHVTILSAKECAILLAIIRRVCAGATAELTPEQATEMVLFVDRYLRAVPPPVQRDVRALLQIFEHSTALFGLGLCRFSQLDAAAQDRVLKDWQRSRIATRRRGFVALKTLSYLAYYREPMTWPALGYTGPTLPRSAR